MVDFTGMYKDDALVIASHKPKEATRWEAILWTFDAYSWMAVISEAIIAGTRFLSAPILPEFVIIGF